MNKNKFVKSLLILVLVLLSTLTLTACGKNSDKFPTGSIDNSVYASAGKHSVTKEELYNEFRFDALSVLQTLIDEKAFSEYLAKVDYTNDDHRKVIEESVNSAVFGTKNIEDLQKNLKQDASKEKKVRSFVDSLVVVGKIVPSQKDELIQELYETVDYANYSDTLLDIYKLKMATRLYAKEQLDKELEDEDSKVFIKDEEIVTYYKNNRQGRYNVTVFYTEFLNLAEQRAAFRKLSIKINNAGAWFEVPDIRITDSTDPNYVDLTEEKNAYIIDYLTRTNNEIKYEDEDGNRVEISEEDYEKYYGYYTFNGTRTGRPDVALDNQEVLEYIIKAHNLVHAEQLTLINGETGEIQDSNGEAIKVEFEYDDFKNSDLRNHVYNALRMPKEGEETNVQFSQRPNTFGEYVYLAYKFNDESETQEGVLNEDKDKFLDGNDDLIAELKEEMIEKRLTDTYINEKVQEFRKEQELNIYDPIIRTLFSKQNEYKGATKVKDNETLASIGDKVITVDEFFEAADKAFGISIANDLLSTKLIREKYYDKITADEKKQFEQQMNQMILGFGQNQYEQSGYPASMGRSDFLLYAFRAKSFDEAIEKLYVIPRVSELFDKDIESHYDDIYEKFAGLSKLQYDNYWLLRSSHLLIYLDQNLDGTPDNPNELSETELAEVHALLPEFVKDLFTYISKSTSEQKGIERLIAHFNDSTRIHSDDDLTNEHRWAEYKRFGFRLKQETLGEITNSSNFLSSNSRLDEVFYARAVHLYNIVKDYKTSQFPYLDFYNGDVAFDPENPEFELGNIPKIQTNFGWHIIMANGVVNEMQSAKLAEQSNDSHLSKELDKDGNPLNGVNTEDFVNATQIEIYLKELAGDYNVQIRVSAAIEKQFGPIKAKYESNQMKSEIKYRLLTSEGLSFTDSANEDKFEGARQINKDQLFDYQLIPTFADGTANPDFEALWGTWFDVFK
ncbi:MAG: hypothetical protein GX232_04120 [Acholeplasmataceae bacterium]|nr:hypothetical protein [Acholeplasmataceae bacterium]